MLTLTPHRMKILQAIPEDDWIDRMGICVRIYGEERFLTPGDMTTLRELAASGLIEVDEEPVRSKLSKFIYRRTAIATKLVRLVDEINKKAQAA